jgi:hypothetical protein
MTASLLNGMTWSFRVPATPPASFIAAFSSGLASALRNFAPLEASPQMITSFVCLSKIGRHFA